MSTPTFDIATSGSGTTSIPAWYHNNSGQYLDVFVSLIGSGANVSGVTYNSGSMAADKNFLNGQLRTAHFYMNNAPTGNYQIAVTLSSGSASSGVSAIAKSYLNGQFNSSGSASTASGTSLSLANGASATQATDDAITLYASTVPTPGGSQTLDLRVLNGGTANINGSHGTGSFTDSWSWSGSQRASLLMVLIDYHVYSSILKYEGVARASISKSSGVALASISKIEGVS
jgi:hypothetical protein